MNIKLVADSSSNVIGLRDIDFASVPLKIVVGEHEFTDNAQVDVPLMLRTLQGHKGRTSTACPSVQDWLDAFGDAEVVYGASITSALSACYSTAAIAAKEYMEAQPERKVFILDTLTTGPEMELLLEKYCELIRAGKDYDVVCEEIRQYLARTRLMFSLESLDNFAKKGRISPALAKAVGLLGIRVVGRASDQGTLKPLHKCRGEQKAIQQLVKSMEASGYCGGKVRIAHTDNAQAANALAQMIEAKFPDSKIRIRENRGLCSYYAERGGVLIGFET